MAMHDPPGYRAEPSAGKPIPSDVAVKPPRPKPEPPIRRRRNTVSDWVLVAICLAGALYGMQSALRRAAGEMLLSGGSLERAELATRITPDNPLAWKRLARTLPDGAAALRRAADLQPGAAEPWIDLALELESNHDLDGAEQALQHAAALDARFTPRWALANFYLRRGREDDFWTSIRGAVAADPARTPSAAALCWRAFDDPDQILERAIPAEPEPLRAYLSYLIDERRLAALPQVWERFEPNLGAADLPLMADLLDDLLAAGDVDFALAVWRSMLSRGLLDYQPPALPDGPYLTNADFAGSVSGVGLDWRLAPAPGVGRGRRAEPGAQPSLELLFSGNQSERTLLLAQVVPVPEGEDLTFTFEYTTRLLPVATGVGWRVRDHVSEGVLAEAIALPAAEERWERGELRFRAPAGVRLARLELFYERASGPERHEGRLMLRGLDLKRAGAEAERN